jgi:hypothetical protein
MHIRMTGLERNIPDTINTKELYQTKRRNRKTTSAESGNPEVPDVGSKPKVEAG